MGCSDVVALGAKGVEVAPEGCDLEPGGPSVSLDSETGVASSSGLISNFGARAGAFEWQFRVDGVVVDSGRKETLDV